MTKLLHIQASPRIGRSASIAVAEHFLGVYRSEHPGDTVETLNLWEADLPEFDGATIDAKYAIVPFLSVRSMRSTATLQHQLMLR